MRVLTDEFGASLWTITRPAALTGGDRSIADLADCDPLQTETAERSGAAPFLGGPYGTNASLAQQCRAAIDSLAPRHRDVLTALVAGYTNKQIARLLGLSPRTVEVYRAGMMSRLHVATLAQTLYIAFMAGMVPSDARSLGAS